jgi:acyl carrier protein
MPSRDSRNVDVLAAFEQGLREIAGTRSVGPLDRDTVIADLGIDSLGLMQIVGILEDELNVVLGDEEIPRLRTVGDVERLILRKRDAQSRP